MGDYAIYQQSKRETIWGRVAAFAAGASATASRAAAGALRARDPRDRAFGRLVAISCGTEIAPQFRMRRSQITPTQRFGKVAGAKVAEVSSWEQESTQLEGAKSIPFRDATGSDHQLRSVLDCAPRGTTREG